MNELYFLGESGTGFSVTTVAAHLTSTEPTSSGVIGEEAGGEREDEGQPLRCLIDGEIEISENLTIESSSAAAASNPSTLQV